VFVNHFKLDMKGQPLASHHSSDNHNGDHLLLDDDLEEEKEDAIDQADEEEDPPTFVNKYTVDFIAHFKNELVLHWAIGKKVPCQWERPDDKYLPALTERWSDGKACQTRFEAVDGS